MKVKFLSVFSSFVFICVEIINRDQNVRVPNPEKKNDLNPRKDNMSS